MHIQLGVPEYSVKEEYSFLNDVMGENKKLPVLTIGRDSYIVQATAEAVFDSTMVYNLQIGRYSSVAPNVTFVIDMNHDYRRPCQGRISGASYDRPDRIKRKGQIVVMNDCWIGEQAVIMSGVTVNNGAVVATGAIVTKDVPAYGIVAGNPAKLIGYRFDKEQIEKLLQIKWWNWEQKKVLENSRDLYGDIDSFIDKHIGDAIGKSENVTDIHIERMDKNQTGEDRRFLYIPDFEQDYPTFSKVIDAFAKTYKGTNTELLLYVKNDDFLEDKLAILDEIFDKYQDVNCYINLYVDNLEDDTPLFALSDGYITNRSKDNVIHMDMANSYNIPIISGVDEPVFEEQSVERMVRL